MRSLVYANLFARKPAADAVGAAYAFPRFVAGQQWTIALRFTDKVNGEFREIFPAVRSIAATIGILDARPVSGLIKWQIGPGASTDANTTAAFNWGEDSSRIAEFLNNLSGFSGANFTVDWDNGSYLVRREDGAPVTITPRSNRLKPISLVRRRSYQVDEEWITEVRYIQAPLAFTDTAEQVLPDPPYIETVVDGYTDGSGTYKQNEVQNLIFPPYFNGQYYARRNGLRTALLSMDDGPDELKAALDVMLEPEGGTVTVTNPSDDIARIEFGGNLSGIDIEPIEIIVPEEGTPPGDWTFTIGLDRAELWAALREKEEISVPFEVRVETYLDPADPDAGTQFFILWSELIKIGRPVLWEGMATSQNIDWLRPPSPKNYKPFIPNQIITGQQQAYPDIIGDGTSTSFPIPHNLNTVQISAVVVRENFAGGRLLRPDEYTVIIDSENEVTIEFDDPPAVDAFAILIVAVGPASVFQNHEHTIAQIENLQDIIDSFGEDISELQEILPSTGPGATATSGTGLVIELPTTAEVLHYRGTENPFTEDGLDPSKLSSRPPYMLPAVHDASLTNTDFDPLEDPSENAGNVFNSVAAASVMLPGGGGIRSSMVKPGGFAACDGRLLYAANTASGTNSYYPASFERTLFTIAVNDKMLALNRTLDVQFGALLQLVNADSRAQWVLVMELGTAPQETIPSPIGLNLQNIVWSSTPIFAQRIVITSEAIQHFFGVRIKRIISGFTLDQQLYGVWGGNNDAAPENANFLLRARLVQFDTENSISQARGWVAWRLIGALTTDDQGNQTITPAKAIIS